MSYERISLEQKDGVAVLKFNHPEVLNAIGARMLEELTDAVSEIAAPDSDVRCVLLTGEGRAFSSGANLSDPGRQGSAGRRGGTGSSLRTGYHPLLFTLRDLDVPIVTAVNGVAAGVGMSFALVGDIVCAARSAYFLQAFARIGLIPDGGATFMLPRLVGWGRAMELSLLAERLPAEQALEWGLINRVFDDDELLEGAITIARQLADGPSSLGLIRRAYWASCSNSYEEQLDLEAKLQTEAGRTRDHKEGVQAFLEKRTARFTGN